MPGGDRTGPKGDGPMTGRGMGGCSTQKTDSGRVIVPGMGRGPGRGFGRGLGRKPRRFRDLNW